MVSEQPCPKCGYPIADAMWVRRWIFWGWFELDCYQCRYVRHTKRSPFEQPPSLKPPAAEAG